jgi:hypothetical protein
MPAMAAPAAIGGVSSLIGSIFGRPRASTSTSQSTSTQTNDPIYGPKGFKLGKMLSKALMPMVQNPTVNPALRTAGRNQINDTYDKQGTRLDSILASRGFGSGGKANLNTLQLEGDRAKSMGSLEGDLYKDAIDRQFQAMGLAAGVSRPIGFNTTTQTNSSGTQPGMPMGQAIGGAVGNIGGDISSYMNLMQMMKKNAATGGGGGGGNSAEGWW